MERQQNSYKINLQLNEYDKKRVCVCVYKFLTMKQTTNETRSLFKACWLSWFFQMDILWNSVQRIQKKEKKITRAHTLFLCDVHGVLSVSCFEFIICT